MITTILRVRAWHTLGALWRELDLLPTVVVFSKGVERYRLSCHLLGHGPRAPTEAAVGYAINRMRESSCIPRSFKKVTSLPHFGERSASARQHASSSVGPA